MQDYYAPVPTLSREERKTHEQDHIMDLIEDMSEAGGSKEAVVEEWMKVNEKKKTAFYDRLKELPEEIAKAVQGSRQEISRPWSSQSQREDPHGSLGVNPTLCESGSDERLRWVQYKSWTDGKSHHPSEPGAR